MGRGRSSVIPFFLSYQISRSQPNWLLRSIYPPWSPAVIFLFSLSVYLSSYLCIYVRMDICIIPLLLLHTYSSLHFILLPSSPPPPSSFLALVLSLSFSLVYMVVFLLPLTYLGMAYLLSQPVSSLQPSSIYASGQNPFSNPYGISSTHIPLASQLASQIDSSLAHNRMYGLSIWWLLVHVRICVCMPTSAILPCRLLPPAATVIAFALKTLSLFCQLHVVCNRRGVVTIQRLSKLASQRTNERKRASQLVRVGHERRRNLHRVSTYPHMPACVCV